MANNAQSIEDLITPPEEAEDESAQAKFSKKQGEIKTKEAERAVEKEAARLGLPYINLYGFPIGPEALSLIEEGEARRLKTICFHYDGINIRLGTEEAGTEVRELLENLNKKYHTEGKIYLISSYSLDHALKLYKSVPKVRPQVKGIEISEEDLDKYSEEFSSFRQLQEKINGAQVSDIITIITAAAVKSNSSDIHIEAEEKEIKIRFRIDGVLHDIAIIDRNLWQKIISRLKILSGVKINVSDKPQDGRISIYTKKERIDIRASFLPTNYGESVVMRLLRSGMVGLAFEDLGIKDRAFNQLKKEVERPNGMIVTTGPTGSGKTTTLYAILKKLNKPETKIITVEDPIEYQLEGVNQSQVNKNYTFAKALRSIVRQDPDVIMVGEIRDLETAEIAIQAALTGHLVLSTIHTNDAAGAIPRFLSMGSKPFLLAPAINALIGQRLVRRLCQKCKQPAKIDGETLKRVKEILEKLPTEYKKEVDFNNLKFYKSAGCPACQEIGYKGQIGIYEILVMNKEIEKLILAGQISEYDIREIAVKNGMVVMVQDGILKALEGITSVEEVFRVAEEK
ncbi:MAG: GspE/PulE family protein [Patescibacteria group bacterium]|nr:GspE/PulE family protein [Patescibacteria group bacterium]